MADDSYDVVVIGAGNAGLVAAVAASEAGCRTLVVEAAPAPERGGNSRFASGVYRIAHAGEQDLRRIVEDDDLPWDRLTIVPYPAERYQADLGRASGGHSDPGLVAELVHGSKSAVEWLKAHGVSWTLSLVKMSEAMAAGGPAAVSLPVGGELVVRGGGKQLVEDLFSAAQAAGVDVLYGASASRLVTDGRQVSGVMVRSGADDKLIQAPAVVLASGGFEASPEARARYLGAGWDLVRVRGSRFNTGAMLERALEAGAASSGQWSGAHAVPVDIAAPALGDLNVGDSSARYSYPYGVMVNRDGRRFLDEGSDLIAFTYAEIGKQILAQPHVIAFQVFDAKGIPFLEPRYSTASPAEAESISELAKQAGISADGLTETLAAFNAACGRSEGFDPTRKDGVASRPTGQPAKSNWALPIDKPPFRAYAVTCGITFTFGGLAVNQRAEVLDDSGRPIAGLYAAGEIAGGFFAFNVPSGAGLARGAVFGRVAAEGAAAYLADQERARGD